MHSMKIPFTDDRADWAKVLEAMYEKQMTTTELANAAKINYEWSRMVDGTNKIEKIGSDTELKAKEFWDAIDYLIEMELVEEEGDHPTSTFGITQNGLRLAHQIKTERQRRNTNYLLVGLTVVLVVLTAFLIGIEFIDVSSHLLITLNPKLRLFV